jgi:2-polyprenyl-3-methyl-5-hydroxy-6-metoxy-1,4-benzoquinol methylase
MTDAAVRYTQFDPEPDSSHNLVVGLVPRAGKVLELGCATGYMSDVLTSRLGCSVVGIEICAEAADRARAHCEQVIVGDAETLAYEQVLGGRRFDAVICADVLEHLRDPGRLLRRLRPVLADGGCVIASIPNIAHGGVRLALLTGEFRYRATGLLDETHLRFFTRESISDLFEAAGYVVTHWRRRRVDIGRTELGLPSRPVPDPVWEWLAADPEATTYQFVVRAVPSDEAPLLRQARMELALAAALHPIIGAIASHVPPGAAFILVDEDQWALPDTVAGRRRVPFLERDGRYWGRPATDDEAVRELERLRRAGAGFMAFGSPAFWWLDHYTGLRQLLRSRFRCVVDDERLVMFDLRE